MKQLVPLTICIFTQLSLKSQQILNATGATISNSNYVIEYSIGEMTAVETMQGTSNFITQGLLQPNIKIINPDCAIINQPFQYIASPTSDIIRLVGQNNWIDAYQIFAADGKLVRQLQFYNNQIDFSNLAAGIYFIRMLPGCDNKYKTIKIFKSTR